MSAMAAEDQHIYVLVKELYDSKQSLVYENCTKALILANQSVDSAVTVEFLQGYFSKLLQILLDQNPSRIGQFEQGHVEKSLTTSIDIILQMLEPSRDAMLHLDALLKIINYQNTYYMGGKVQWQNLPGRPQLRVNLLQRFQKAGGFLKLHAMLTAPRPDADDNNRWLGAERLQLIMKALIVVDPTFLKTESVNIRSEVMRQLLTLPEDTVKKESTDFINNLITSMRPKSKNDAFFKTYNIFWLEHTSRMMNCKSILLKLFAWEQMHDITREAARTRPTPAQYVVSNAGTDEVNGVYVKLPPKSDASTNEPPMYRKEASTSNGKEFTIVRCNMKSQAKWWYLSIVDPYSPGGAKDIDYYQHKSSIDEHSEPPELNWDTMANPVLGKPPAPTLTRMARTPDPEGFNETVLRWVVEQKLIEKVFGSGIHREIVSRSKSLVLLLVLENRLAEESVTAIFRVGMTHQEDDIVEEVFGLLAPCSRYMDDSTYTALMGNLREAIQTGGAENIQRVTMFLKKIQSESMTQMRSTVAKEQLAVAVWALHQHPLFAASFSSSSSQHTAIAELLLFCLKDDSQRAVQCLHECCQQLSDSSCNEKVVNWSINTLQFFLTNHFSLGLADVLADGTFHDTLMVELHRFVTSHFQPQGSQNRKPHQPQPPSPSGVTPSTALDALARRLQLIRCAYGVSPSVSMSLAVLRQVWELVSGPEEREQVFLFLRNAATNLPSLAPVFDTSECQEIFESLLCSPEIDWTVSGAEAYYCFEAYLSALPSLTPESTRRLGRNQLWQIALKMPHQAVAEEAVARLLKCYLDSATDNDSDEEIVDSTRSAGGAVGPYAELLDRVFQQLASVQSQAAQSLASDLTARSIVSRCTTLLTGLLGKSKVHHDTPHGVRGSLFRIKVIVRYQEVLSMVYGTATSYPTSRAVTKHKTRSLEKTMEVEVHPMHSLHMLKEKIMDKAIVTNALRNQPRSSRKVDVRFCHLKLEGLMLPLAHFGIGHDSEIHALLGGGDDNCSDYDDYNSDYYSRNKLAPPIRVASSDEGSVEGETAGVGVSDNSIIGEFTKEENFHCLLSLVELLDGQNEDASSLASGLWRLLMSIPTQPALLQEVERQFHYSREGEEGVLGWEAVLLGHRDSSPASSSGVYMTYVMQIMDSMLQPAPELQVDHGIAEVTKDRFISTGGFSTTLSNFVQSSGSSPLGKLFLSTALHVLHYCLFTTPEVMNDGDSSIDGLDLDVSHVSLGVDVHGDGDAAGGQSVVSPMLIAQVQESSSAVLDKLLTVAYNAALSGESEIVKDALGTITSLLESPAVASQLTSSPQAKGLLTAVLRSSAKPVRHMATNFAVQVGRSQPVVIEWLLAEIEVVAPTDKYCYNLFKALCVLVCYTDDPRNVSGLTLDLEAMGTCLSSKLMVFQHFTMSERLKHKQFELVTEAEGEKSMLLGSLELLRSVLEVTHGYSALKKTPLGRDLISIFMQDFLCPLPDYKPQEDRGGDKIPICDTKPLRSAAFAVLTACVQAAPEHSSAVMTHIHALSRSSTAAQLLKEKWGLQVAHDLKKPDIEFSGLRNHGCTCYLNSLIQQLFMNRGFRKAILSVPLKEIYRSTLWHLSDEELVGRQYEFEWAPQGTWHPGVVTHFDPDSKLHTIQYAAPEGRQYGQKSVLDIRQGVHRKGRDGETGRVRAMGVAEEDLLSERESQAVVVLEELQRTFCFMEKSEKRHFDPKLLIDACKTLNLEFNVYHQNDASEMLDKLLDRLETAMKGKPTGGVDMYAELNTHTFGGKMLYQKIPKECSVYETDKRDCGHWQGTRDEVFFKTEVTVRGCEKISDALEHVVEGELMDGDNKIMCDVCNTKKDTVRRTCFGTLPNCLVVHLKRFDLDYETFETVKLNTRMEFDTKLNMYPYTKEGIEAAEEAAQQETEEPSLHRTSSKSEDVEVAPPVPEVDMEQYAYELQGVLVHSGIAQGGHYYSYIHDGAKGGSSGAGGVTGGVDDGAGSLDEQKWYLFDDDEVAPFAPSNIPEQCYGGKFSPGGGAVSSSSSDDGMDRHSNALLLFYNKVRPREIEVAPVSEDARNRTISGDQLTSNESKGSETGGTECRLVDGYAAFSREVGHSNARHILTKYLIDLDLHSFVQSLLSSITTSAAGASSELMLRGVRFGCHFLLDVVLHCRDRRGARQWVTLLKDIFAVHPDTALAFLQEFVFAKKSHVLKEFLLMCGDSLARITFVQLLSGAVAALVPSDETALHDCEGMTDSELLRIAVDHRAQGSVGVGPPILALLVHCIMKLLQIAPLHLHHCDELFGVFRELASYPALCSYMLKLEMVPRLLYFVNSGGPKKSDRIKEFYEMAERPTSTGHVRHVGAESHHHHSMVFEAVAALLGVPQQPKADLLEDATLTPQARAAFVEIFEEHGQRQAWNTRDVMSYMEFVDEKHAKTALDARSVMDRYASGGENLLMLEGYLRYVADRAYYNPRTVWKELRAFQFRNNLTRLAPADASADVVLRAPGSEATSLSALSNETIFSLLSDPEVLAIGMGVSELATVAIVTRMSGKHSIYVVQQACKLLYNMLKDWNWQTKDAPVVSLISTLLKIDDDFTNERISMALTCKDVGFLNVVMSSRHQHHHHQQYDVYSHQSLQQRYQELLKNLLAVPKVREYVQERAAVALAEEGRISEKEKAQGEQFVWLAEQISQLLRRGFLDSSVLIRHLKQTLVEVSGAGEDAVNGKYRFSRLLEHNTALYKKDAAFRNKTVTFQIYRCRMDNHVYQWFISIVPAGKEPGTNADEDFYCKPSTWKPPPSNQQQYYQQMGGTSISLYGGCAEDVKPPEGPWIMVNSNKSSKVHPPPTIRWVDRMQGGDLESEEEDETDDVVGDQGQDDSDSESDKEDSMAVVDDEDGFDYFGRGDLDLIDDDDI